MKLKLLTMMFLACIFSPGFAQTIDKKLIEKEKELKYDRAPQNKYIGTQVNATKANVLSQGFNGGSVPTGWSVVDVLGTTGDVIFVTTSTYPSGYVPTEGTHMARFNSYDAAAGNNVRLAQTTSFSTVGYINTKVNFDWLMDPAYSGNRDSVYVQWSTDGTTWNTAGGRGRYSATAGWTAQSITLPAGANNQATLYVAFLFISKYGNNCHLDNLVVTADLLLANDLSVTGWVAPANGSDIDATDTVKIAVTNLGTANATGFDISYSVNGGSSFTTQNIPGTLNAGATQNYTFTTTANMGIYQTYSCMGAVALSGDGNTTNDTLKLNITKTQPVIIDTFYTELTPLWTGTVDSSSIVNNSYVRVVSGATGVADTTGWMKFNTTGLPDNAFVSNVQLHAYVNNDNYAYFRVMSLENDPMLALPNALYNDTKDGDIYYAYTSNFPSPGWFVQNLGAAANTDVMANAPDNWFGIGLWEYETAAGYYLGFDGWQETNKPYIVVSYQIPLAKDIAMMAVTSPVTGYNPSNNVTVRIKNMGTDPATEIPVSFTFNSTTYNETTPVGDTLQYGDEYLYTFAQTVSSPTPGVYGITAFHTYPGDVNAANNQVVYSYTKYAPFYPLAVNFNTQAFSACYGPVYKDGNYLLSQWNTNKIFMLDNTGAVIDTLTMKSHSGYRDLSADTNYIYGGSNTAMLYKDTIAANDTVYTVSNYTTAISVRGSDYDPINNAFWVCNWNAGTENILLVNKNSGATLQTVVNPNAGLYGFGGLAYDYWTPGGPYIVGVSQHNQGNQLVWIKIADGTVLVDHNVVQDIPEILTAGAIAGGGFSSDEAIPGSVILGGVSQSFRLYAFEIASSDISAYSIPGGTTSPIDTVLNEIHVNFPNSATLTGLAPTFTLGDYHGLSTASVNNVLQTSGVNTYTLADGDTIIYHVVRENVNGIDSIFTDWKVIIHVLANPTVVTNAATIVGFTSAQLNGTINPNLVAFTDAYFEYGTSVSYGTMVSPVDTTADGMAPVSFNAAINGLTPNTTYHFRFVGMVGATPYYGADSTFTTYFLAINPSIQNVDNSAGNIDFNVTCYTNWTATSDQVWCTVPASGTGDGLLNAVYTANGSGSIRTAMIILSSGTQADTAYLTQDIVSVNEAGLPSVNIYPNPSEGMFNVETSGTYAVQVINALGEVVLSTNMTDRKVIDLSTQRAGMYILRLKSNDHILNRQLLVK
ncbi:MAG: T9SS type A sorting domain-containing protein [Bacteroidota bacterium]